MRGTFFQEAETKERLIDFIRAASRLSMGEECLAFEKDFAAWQKRIHAIFVSSGSTANLILLQALLNLGRLNKGDRIGFSSLTWSTNVMPIIQLGLVPVPLDCELSTLNVSPQILNKDISNVQAVFLTNVLGLCDDLSSIATLCKEHNVLLLEDNCESLGSMHKGTLLGNFGLASTNSFFVGHHLSTIEGGMVCTDDADLAEMLIMVRAHGWDRQLSPERQKHLRDTHHISNFHALYTFYELAYNARPTEINGFLGHLQLPLLMDTLLKREQQFHQFLARVQERSDVYERPDASQLERVSSFAMAVVCKSPEICKETVQRFQAADVEVRPIIAGDITQHPFYTKYATPVPCPNAAEIHKRGFYFPNHADLTSEEVQFLCALL